MSRIYLLTCSKSDVVHTELLFHLTMRKSSDDDVIGLETFIRLTDTFELIEGTPLDVF